MKKQTIKLNESQLRKIIKESVKKVLKENVSDEQVETHNKMWRCLTDAFNYAIDIREGAELYKDAFEEQVFPIIRKIDKTLGW